MSTVNASRRQFLKHTLAGGAALVVGVDSVGVAIAAGSGHGVSDEVQLNPFVIVASDGTVTVVIKHFEMGQGTTTGLATLVAEEMDADWSDVRVEFAPADDSRYQNLLFGLQATGGSTAMANSYQQYRKAGAVARDLLVRAAAAEWGLDAHDVSVQCGRLIAAGRSAHFGEFVAAASALEVDPNVEIKSPEAFTLIGSPRLPRKDSSAKTNGTAEFAIDVQLPNMLYAVLLRSPKFGGVLVDYDDVAALDVKGCVGTKVLPNKRAIAVYATNSWAAIKARKLINAQWDNTAAEQRSSPAIAELARQQLASPQFQGRAASTDEVAPLLAEADEVVEIDFSFPFLAHAPMEPLVCVIEPTSTGVRLHDGCQQPGLVKPAVAAALNLAPDQVEIRTVYAGGSFGRRATADADYQVEAAMAFSALDKAVPLKLMWTREDDIRGGKYRPLALHSARVGLNRDGTIKAWQHSVIANPLVKGTPFEAFMVKNGVDASIVEGLADTHYAVPNFAIGISDLETPVTALWWRSVGHSHNAYVVETVLDMLASRASVDPIAYRLALLSGQESGQRRMAGVISAVKDLSQWVDGDRRGFAAHASFASYVAVVADVSISETRQVKVNKLFMAVDCGIAINPDVIRAQMEGGAGFALGAVMRNEITLKEGIVEQQNFPDYKPLRISDMPAVEVVIVPSNEAPTGVGEPGVPPVGPAVANAIFAQTGERITELPMSKNGFTFV